MVELQVCSAIMQLWSGTKCLDGEVDEAVGQCWTHDFVQGLREALEEGVKMKPVR